MNLRKFTCFKVCSQSGVYWQVCRFPKQELIKDSIEAVLTEMVISQHCIIIAVEHQSLDNWKVLLIY